jgi:hypothetical protein
MSATKLTPSQLQLLRPLEIELQEAVKLGESETAIELASQIQTLFSSDRHHHRLLRAKLWAFESCLNDNRTPFAESGFIGIRSFSSPSTRLYVEATALLAICMLRQKKIAEAKNLIKDAIGKINNITSDQTRHKFQQRLIERIEEECIFAELIGAGDDILDPKNIEETAILLIQRSDTAEILEIIGRDIPKASMQLLGDVRTYSINQLPAPDRKLLPPLPKTESPQTIGKTAFSILKRIAWKTFCKPSSTLHKLWSAKIPKVFNEGYFSAAVVSTFADHRIGLPLLASGVTALIMKYSAEEFCEIAKPKNLMIDKTEKE